MPATQLGQPIRGGEEKGADVEKDCGSKDVEVTARAVDELATDRYLPSTTTTMVDVTVNESLTLKSAFDILVAPVTWLPAFAYLTTFGLELLVNSKLADVLFALFDNDLDGFNQNTAGFYTAILSVASTFCAPLILILDMLLRGLLNLFTRPFGGYVGDVVYRRWGTKGKKYWMLLCGLIMGVACNMGGLYLADDRLPKVAERKLTILPLASFSNRALPYQCPR